MNYNKEIEEVLKGLLRESKTKVILTENFLGDFKNFLATAWEQQAEKKIIQVFNKNKENIENDPEKGKNYISQFLKQNKSLIEKGCTNNFINILKSLSGDTIAENVKLKYIKNNRDNTKQKKMYRYYKVQFLNESKVYVAVPPFAINTLKEHETVLGFALESKQIKTDKGVDYVIEVSPKEYEEIDTELESSFGAKIKEEKPQDASIKSSKNKFDSVKQEKGAEQKDSKNLTNNKDQWSFLFENEDLNEWGQSEYDDYERQGASTGKLKENEFEENLNSYDPDDIMGDESTKHMTKSEEINQEIDEADYMEGIGCVNEEVVEEASAAWDKAIGKSHYNEDEEMVNGEKKCEDERILMDDTDELNENDTSDMSVPMIPAYQSKEVINRRKNLNSYGEENEEEYLSDDEILQERFEKFVLKNCQGAINYLHEGKFYLQDFLDSKSFGFIKLLENEFKKTLPKKEDLNEWGQSEYDDYEREMGTKKLHEDNENGEFEVDDCTLNDDKLTIVYYYPKDDESKDLTVPASEFWDYLENTDPENIFWSKLDKNSEGWEDEVKNDYWNSYNFKEQTKILKDFLIDRKGVSLKESINKNFSVKKLNSVVEKENNFKRFNNAEILRSKEVKNFKSLINEDIANRSFSNIKESDLLKDKDSKNYTSSWNVKSVGTVNLKNGLNEVYSNIIDHSNENNLLVATKDGNYFIMKGNLKERSKIGTKKDLVDLERKKNFGEGTVIGIYENSLKGLGEIMYKVRKTRLPLLTWK